MTGMPDVAGRILRLDPQTRDALFRGIGPDRREDLAAVPKDAVLKALDHRIAGRTGASLRAVIGTAGR